MPVAHGTPRAKERGTRARRDPTHGARERGPAPASSASACRAVMPLSALVPMSGCCDQRPCPGSRNRRRGVSGRWRRGRGYTRGSAVGAFGPGLYSDDFAADLRTPVSTVCRLPLSRPELVATLEWLEPAAAGSSASSVATSSGLDSGSRHTVLTGVLRSAAKSSEYSPGPNAPTADPLV